MHSSPGGGGEHQRIPRIAPGWDPTSCSLTPAEGFLLSRIDGHTPWNVLREIGGIAPEEVDRYLHRFSKEGWILVAGGAGKADSAEDPRASGGEAPRAESEVASDRKAEASPAIDAAEIDTGLDLSAELQQSILAFEDSLDRNYFDLLGVGREADVREIKRAYFRLSKQYHPDRYFRRNIGTYAQRLDRIFKKICEAYELLSDPTTRAEVERTLAESEPPVEGAYQGGGGKEEIGPKRVPRPTRHVPERIRHLKRLRARFKVSKKALVERQFKARQFFQAAQAAAHQKRWLEAAASMRLAIAFDPTSPEYKVGLAEIQADVHRVRAEQLIEQASGAGEKADALKLLEEALFYRPCDVALNRKTAELCLELSDLGRALECADTLCEVESEEAAHHALRARILRRQRLPGQAREALAQAVSLDPSHPDVAAERQQQLRRGHR